MLKQYTAKEAQDTILRRTQNLAGTYPPDLIAGVERIFGEGVTPPEAVARILASIVSDGDQAIAHWSQTFDNFTGEAVEVPPARLSAAVTDLPSDLREALDLAID